MIREKVYRAAMIPYFIEANGDINMIFMQPSDSTYGGTDFQLAKGHIDDGESDEEAAIREGIEELGLRMDNVKSINLLGNYLGRTTVFICEVFNKRDFDDFTEETQSTRWLTAEEFARHGRDIHIHVIEEAVKFIRSQSQSI